MTYRLKERTSDGYDTMVVIEEYGNSKDIYKTMNKVFTDETVTADRIKTIILKTTHQITIECDWMKSRTSQVNKDFLAEQIECEWDILKKLYDVLWVIEEDQEDVVLRHTKF